MHIYVLDIEILYKRMISQTIEDLKYDINAYIDYNKQRYQAILEMENITESNLKFNLNYMENIIKNINKVEIDLLNYLNNNNQLINNEIKFKFITKNYPFNLYLFYMLIFSMLLGVIIQLIINIFKK